MSRESSFSPFDLVKTLWKTSDNIAIKYKHAQSAFRGLKPNYVILNVLTIKNPELMRNFGHTIREQNITNLYIFLGYINLDKTLALLGNALVGTNITNLYLDCNNLNAPKALVQLGNVLAGTNVKSLDLSSNGIKSLASITALAAALAKTKVTCIKLANNDINPSYLIDLIRNTNITDIEGVDNLSQDAKEALVYNREKLDSNSSNNTDSKDFENKNPIILEMQKRRGSTSIGLNFVPPARQQQQPSKTWVHMKAIRNKKYLTSLMSRDF